MSITLKSVFFRVREPRKFNYKPRFYDPRKEEHELRVQRIKHELGMVDEVQKNNTQNYVPKIKGTFAAERKHTQARTVFELISSKRIRIIVRIISVLLIVVMGYLLSIGLKTIFFAHEAKKNEQIELRKKQDDNIVEENYTNIVIEDE